MSRNNFQSSLLIAAISISLLITGRTKIEDSMFRQPASFGESVAASSLVSAELIPGLKETLPKNSPAIDYGSSTSLYGNLVVSFPQAFLPKAPAINLKSKIVLVSDLDNENDFINYNANQRWPLASITKLMTAVLAIEAIGKEKETMASLQAMAAEGNAGKLEEGKLYKVEDLIRIMILISSNHAAVALADFYVFGPASFVKLMNQKAAEIGMSQTVFFDSTGLSPLNQSTANDIRKLIGYIINNHPEILAYSREKGFGDYPNNNYFAGQPNFLGGKTGYLDEIKQNLVSLFSVNNRRILIIVLGTEDRFGQTQELLDYLLQYEY